MGVVERCGTRAGLYTDIILISEAGANVSSFVALAFTSITAESIPALFHSPH